MPTRFKIFLTVLLLLSLDIGSFASAQEMGAGVEESGQGSPRRQSFEFSTQGPDSRQSPREQPLSADWLIEKNAHFIVKYQVASDSGWVKRLLRTAEEDYQRIAAQISYSRYDDFWTWDQRVTVVVYPDQATFVAQTGQPVWSRGGAIDHPQLQGTREIITYKQEEDFIDGILPHEIAHLMVHDFIGPDHPLPVWFDEGLAQAQERRQHPVAQQYMRMMIRKDAYIPVAVLMTMDVRTIEDKDQVALFYIESASLVKFLIRRFGATRFSQFCRNLKDGKTFFEALSAASPTDVFSLEELEKKWLRYMQSE